MFLTFTNLIFIVKSCKIDLENVFKKVDGEIPIFSFDKSPIKNFTLPYRPEKFNDGGYYDMFFIQNDLMKVDDTLQEFVLKSLENPLYSMSFLKLWNLFHEAARQPKLPILCFRFWLSIRLVEKISPLKKIQVVFVSLLRRK